MNEVDEWRDEINEVNGWNRSRIVNGWMDGWNRRNRWRMESFESIHQPESVRWRGWIGRSIVGSGDRSVIGVVDGRMDGVMDGWVDGWWVGGWVGGWVDEIV